MSDTVSPAKVGDWIGEYELLEAIGRGGMGTVFKARSREGKVVAVKVLAPELTNKEVQRKRFYREAGIAMLLDHPNMVRALEVGEDEGRHFFAMEFVDGESLGKRLKREGKLDEPEACKIIVAVARALDTAHREGLIHRDVKPDNILTTAAGDVKLADMGLVKQLDSDMNLTRTGRGLGTPHFMAPEQFRNAKNADARADIYSLGATLYMMVTGEMPFKGNGPLDTFLKKSNNDYPSPKKLNPSLSDRTAQIIQMAMSPDPGSRPASARAFARLITGRTTPEKALQEYTRSSPTMIDSEEGPLWFVKIQNADGTTKKVRGVYMAVVQQIRRGLIKSDATVSQASKGPYTSILQVKEFRTIFDEQGSTAEMPEWDSASEVSDTPLSIPHLDTVIGTQEQVRKQAEKNAPAPPRRVIKWWILAVAIVVSVASALAITWFFSR